MKAVLIVAIMAASVCVAGLFGYVVAPRAAVTREKSPFAEGNYLISERVIAWSYTETVLTYAYLMLDSYYDNYSMSLNHYLLGRAYYRQQLVNLENDLNDIDSLAGSEWDVCLDKLRKALDWHIQAYDNDTLYRQTGGVDAYYQAYTVAISYSDNLVSEAWNLMPTPT